MKYDKKLREMLLEQYNFKFDNNNFEKKELLDLYPKKYFYGKLVQPGDIVIEAGMLISPNALFEFFMSNGIYLTFDDIDRFVNEHVYHSGRFSYPVVKPMEKI